MEALLPAFLTAALAEMGDKTQLLAVALAARFGRPAPVLAGIALAALANGLMAATAGSFIHGTITLRATTLLVGVALLFLGISRFIPQRAPSPGAGWTANAFLASLTAFFFLEIADKTQFVTAALAARYDALLLAALGATAGIVLANAPFVLLAAAGMRRIPPKGARTGIGLLFLIAGFATAVTALELV